MKTCPYCKEEIHGEAVRCKHCAADLLPHDSEQPVDSRHITYVLDRDLVRFVKVAAAVLAVFLTVGAFLYGFDLRQMAREIRQAQEETRQSRLEVEKLVGVANSALAEIMRRQTQAEEIVQKLDTIAAPPPILGAHTDIQNTMGRVVNHFNSTIDKLNSVVASINRRDYESAEGQLVEARERLQAVLKPLTELSIENDGGALTQLLAVARRSWLLITEMIENTADMVGYAKDGHVQDYNSTVMRVNELTSAYNAQVRRMMDLISNLGKKT